MSTPPQPFYKQKYLSRYEGGASVGAPTSNTVKLLYASYLDEIHVHFPKGSRNNVGVSFYRGPSGTIEDENILTGALGLGVSAFSGDDEVMDLTDLKLWIEQGEYVTIGLSGYDSCHSHAAEASVVFKRILDEVNG